MTNEKGTLNTIIKYWPVVVVILGMIMTGLLVRFTVQENTKDIGTVTMTVNDIDHRVSDNRRRLDLHQLNNEHIANVLNDISKSVETTSGGIHRIELMQSEMQGQMRSIEGDVSELKADVRQIRGNSS